MRKPEPKGRILESDRPLRIAPIACSRMPKCRLRPAGLAKLKSPAPSNVRRVLQEGARSAEPPISQGTFLARILSTLPEESRVAKPLASGGKVDRPLSQPSGN